MKGLTHTASGGFFTVKINQTGYSDQLNQFMLIHEFGVRLGLTYVYSDIPNSPSRFNETAQKFIDVVFGAGMETGMYDMYEKVPLIIDPRDFADKKAESGQMAIDLLKTKVLVAGTVNTLFVMQLGGDRNLLYELLSDFDDEVNAPIRSAMNACISGYAMDDLYPFDARIKIFIHLRFGDVTRLATPWSHDYNLWNSQDLGALEVNTPESMRILRVCVRELTEVYGADQICFSIHSDNFDLAYEDYTTLMKDNPLVSDEQVKICQHLLTEMSAELGLFSQFKNAKVFITKDPKGVEKLTASLVKSDLAITNGMQRMIAKLIGIFTIDKPLALASLMESNEDKAFHTLALPRQNVVDFIPLVYGMFSFKPLIQFINENVIHTIDPWEYPVQNSHHKNLSAYCCNDLYKVGCELQKAGQMDDALRCFERAEHLSNSNKKIKKKKIEVLVSLGKMDKADRLLLDLKLEEKAVLNAEKKYISTKFMMGEKEALKKLTKTD